MNLIGQFRFWQLYGKRIVLYNGCRLKGKDAMDLSSIPQWAVPVEPVSEAQIVKTYTADVVI